MAFSRDHLLNDLCFSSFYGVAAALSRLGHEAHAAEVYGAVESDQAVVDGVRDAMLTVAAEDFVSDSFPTLHRQTASVARTQPLNLVILLEESLGAQYVASLGGDPIAPFMDSLRHEGWWFEQMYATGSRSARGIEAVISGFLPAPARSTIKLDDSQEGFFTLAQLLSRAGYRTQFVYGGQSSFDNMGPFFRANGFDEIIDQDDYRDPVFMGPWGVSDEDIFARAHESFMAAGEQPFFSLVFSVSNHPPWLYPDGRVAPVDGRAASPASAARYADDALRGFFEAARGAPYFERTIFVVVADHDARVYGPSLVPIEHFHLPAVIIGPGVETRSDPRQVSQIDLGPTLLSLLGLSLEHPMVGYDLTALADDATGRAIMQYGQNQAFMRGNQVVVQQPARPARQFERIDGALEPVALDPQLARQALVHALLPSMLYRDRSYRLRD